MQGWLLKGKLGFDNDAHSGSVVQRFGVLLVFGDLAGFAPNKVGMASSSYIASSAKESR